MCLIYNPDAAAVLLPRGHSAAAAADPRAWGSSVLSSTCHASRLPWKAPKRIIHGAQGGQASGVRVRSHRIALTLRPPCNSHVETLQLCLNA